MASQDDSAFILTWAILKQWALEVRAVGAEPFILVVAMRKDVYSRKMGTAADDRKRDLLVEEFCRSQRIPCLNLTYGMAQWPDEAWLSDGVYLSPDGHVRVAKALFDALRSKNLLPKK